VGRIETEPSRSKEPAIFLLEYGRRYWFRGDDLYA